MSTKPHPDLDPIEPPEPRRPQARQLEDLPNAPSRRLADLEQEVRLANRSDPRGRADYDHLVEDRDEDRPGRRSFADRMFNIGWMGWIRLAMLSVVVGVIVRAAGVDPLAPDFTFTGALQSIGRALGELAGWAVANGWLPLLVGAAIVAPVWLLWRLLSLPFRNQAPAHVKHFAGPSRIDIDS